MSKCKEVAIGFARGGLGGSPPPLPSPGQGGASGPLEPKIFSFPCTRKLEFLSFFFANLFKRITKNTNFGYFFLKKTSKFRKVLALHAELNTLFWDFFFGNTVGVPIAVQKR